MPKKIKSTIERRRPYSLRAITRLGAKADKGIQYRNLFGTPERIGEHYRGVLRKPSLKASGRTKRQDQRLTKEQLSKFAACLIEPFDWTWEGLNKFSSDDKDAEQIGSLPAGYTYLAQLVAHDMVHSAAALDVLEGGTTCIPRNFRNTPMVLDTIYGGGPNVSPLAYALDTHRRPADQRKSKLRLSRTLGDAVEANKTDEADEDAPKKFRDIGRSSCPFANELQNNWPSNVLNDRARPMFRDALIADPRNDDNLIISQLLVVYHRLHEIVFDEIGEKLTDSSVARTKLEQFRIARQLVTLIYRTIVRTDLLPRLLGVEINNAYSKRFDQHKGYLDKDYDGRVPVEFTHAAYRFGHALIRPEYQINNKIEPDGVVLTKVTLGVTSEGDNAAKLPLESFWWVHWHHFFELSNGAGGVQPQKARKISPVFVDALNNANIVSHFDTADAEERHGLTLRDLWRSTQIGTRTVASLYAEFGNRLGKPPELADPKVRAKRIGDWLETRFDNSGLSTDDRRQVRKIAKNPPLSFYVLFEAAVEEGGLRLGFLGSAIVAETLFQSLEATRQDYEENPILATIAKKLFGGKGHPKTMASLIKFVTRKQSLDDFLQPT